uniref:Chitin-binding type-2 domain-containing protein n=1 Tax=Anopheles christyi TaxID=43041 RepID=A0A182KBR6_9DIPT
MVMKYLTLIVVLLATVRAEPGEKIPNHPNCPDEQGPLPFYFIHPTNCSRFYECDRKDAWEYECPDGLHFNVLLNVCDFPATAQCVPGSPWDPTTTTVWPTVAPPLTTTTTEAPPLTTTTTRTTTTPDYTTTTWASTWTTASTTFPYPSDTTTEAPTVDPRCPPSGATLPNYWAHSTNCSKYFGCLENCVKEFKCPEGLYWNDEQKRCDSFSNAHCGCPVIPPAPNMWPTTSEP